MKKIEQFLSFELSMDELHSHESTIGSHDFSRSDFRTMCESEETFTLLCGERAASFVFLFNSLRPKPATADFLELFEAFALRFSASDAFATYAFNPLFMGALGEAVGWFCSASAPRALRGALVLARAFLSLRPKCITALLSPLFCALLEAKAYRTAHALLRGRRFVEVDVRAGEPRGDGDVSAALQSALVASTTSTSSGTAETSPSLRDLRRGRHPLTSAHVLGFLYYAGMACLGARDHALALHYLSMAARYPGPTSSRLSIEAQKRALLCSLLCDDSAAARVAVASPSPALSASPASLSSSASSGLSSSTSSAMASTAAAAAAAGGANTKDPMARLCQPYLRFHAAALGRDVERARAAAVEAAPEAADDGLGGLLRQAVGAVVRAGIRRLAETYTTLELARLAEMSKLDGEAEARRQIARIASGSALEVKVSVRHGVVAFGSARISPADRERRLWRAVEELAVAQQAMRELDEVLLTTKPTGSSGKAISAAAAVKAGHQHHPHHSKRK